ncbi:MAG: glycosyltransferase [Lachnospiraceae bacterium]|nr:glycosyltransferase [Lachnospiraceae bacterium]
MKISVIMASYNGARYITEQLNSIDNQSVNPDEIIIVDDASDDNTKELIKTFFEDTDITGRLVEHTKNIGYRDTFFDALSYAAGDVIFLCDQDDVWQSDKIEKMLKVMKDNESVKALNTSYKLIDCDGNEISEGIRNGRRNKDKRKLYGISLEQVLSYNAAMGCTMAFTSDIKDLLLEHINEKKTYNIPHDWIINIAAALSDGLYMLNEELIYYRLHGDNTIGLNRAATIEKRIKDYEEMSGQKMDMLKLLKLLDRNAYEKEYNFMKLMVKSYHIRCEMLGRKSIAAYLRNYKRYNLKRVMDKKTMLYDLYLIKKKNKPD